MQSNKISNLKDRIIRGMFMLVVREFLVRGFSIIGQIILVRMIAPEVFGVFAILLFLLNFFELFTDLGFTQAIVQQKNKLTDEQLGNIIFIRLSLALIAFALLLLSFPLIKNIYPHLNNEHFKMLFVLSIMIIPKTLKNIYFALLDRQLSFNLISIIDIAGTISYFLVAMILAFNNFVLWSFILALVTKELIELFIAIKYKSIAIHITFDFNSIRKMMKYGSFLQIGNIIAFIEQSIIPIAGRSLSSHQLGLLQWSSSVANISDVFFNNFGRVAFAGMSKIQNKRNKLELAVNKSISILNSIALLFSFLIFGFAKEFIILILNDHWLPSLPSLYWFVGSLIFYCTSLTLAHALLSIGKSKEVTILTGISIIIEIVIAVVFTKVFGFVGIAVAVFITYMIQFIGFSYLANLFNIHLKSSKIYLSKIPIAIFLWLSILVINSIFNDISIAYLFIKLTISVFVYFTLLCIFSLDDVKELRKILLIVKNK